MKYTLLGRSGVRVSELCLGAMRFGRDAAVGTDEATSREIFETYANEGGNFIDTANVYNGGAARRWWGLSFAAIAIISSSRPSIRRAIWAEISSKPATAERT